MDGKKVKKKSNDGFLGGLFKKEQASYDDGMGNAPGGHDEKGAKVMYVIMSIYGGVMGFLGCQYCKYLHQRFACKAWGIPLTSKHVKSYGAPQILIDIIAIFVVYFLIGSLGMLINRFLKYMFSKSIKQCDEAANEALMYGLMFLVVVSVLFIFIPLNIFLIGV